MSTTPRRSLWVLAASPVILMVACGTPAPQGTDEQSKTAPPRTSVHARVAQFAFGSQAVYVLCAEPACPKVTAKTLPGATVANAAIAPVMPDIVAARAAPVVAGSVPPAPRPVTAPSMPAALPRVPPAPATTAGWNVARVQASAPPLTVTFSFASAELPASARAAIRAALASARRAERIVIAGRTDDVGDASVNARLALNRAIAVRNYFRDLEPGLPGTFVIDAKGACCYVADNTLDAGRARNRRVEVVFQATAGGAS